MKNVFACCAAMSVAFIETGVSEELIIPGRTFFDSRRTMVGYVSGIEGDKYVVQRKSGDAWVTFYFSANGFESQSEPNIYFAARDCGGQALIRSDSSTISTFVGTSSGSASSYVTSGRLYQKSGIEFVGWPRSSRIDSVDSSCITPPSGYGAMLVAPFQVINISGLVGPFKVE
jgi:hypothetical protein